MKFKKRKTIWHHKRLKDPYFKEAKIRGYRSRSALKLLEINKKFRIFKKGQNALDIGASPGGWSQVLSEKVFSNKEQNKIIGVDIKEIKPVPNIIMIKKDIFDFNFIPFIKKYTDGLDLIISDAAKSTTGNKLQDQLSSLELCNKVFEISENVLKKGGSIILKIFQSKEMDALNFEIKKNFLIFNLYKPKSSNKDSKEIYIIGKFFK